MNTNILSLFSFSFLFSCCQGSKQNIDGGPCSYSVKHYQAEVISIDSLRPSEFNLKFITPGYSEDTFSFYRLYNSYISSSMVKEKKMHPGQKIPFNVETIREGSCNPLVTRLMIDSI